MKTGVVLLACLLPLALDGCSDSTVPVDDDKHPHAEIEIYFKDYVTEGYPFTHFDVNPLRCSDDITPRHRLDVRWDFQDDGHWDTEFEPLEYIDGVRLSPLPRDVWRVRCEVRDGISQVSTAVDSVRMPEDWYVAPDIVARRAVVDTIRFEFSTTDTVTVGQTCWILLSTSRWLDAPLGVPTINELYIDGELATTRTVYANPNLHWGVSAPEWHPYYDEPFVFDNPGTHTLTVVVDATDVIAETDETNNSFTRELVVIDDP